MMTTLGRLEKVDLRAAWANEAGDFTPWLAKDENIVLLGNTIGIELEVEGQEEGVGPYRADILCKDTANNNWVLIENQLEKTDHCHLGQLLTYAAGLEAVTIVWIAERFTDEHRAALDWLNEKTDEDVNFFGLEIELWKIGNSDMAPKFNIVSQPNDWSQTVKKTAGSGELSDNGKMRLDFWTGFNNYLVENNSIIKPRTPNADTWLGYGIGKSGVYLAAIFSFWSNVKNSYEIGEIRAELVVSREYAQTYYNQLYVQREDIEKQLGFDLEWYVKDGQTARGAVIRNTVDVRDKSQWLRYYQWLKEHLEKMHTVIAPLAKQLSSSAANEIEE